MSGLSLTPRARSTTVLVAACALLATAGIWGAVMVRADAGHDRPVGDAADYGPLSADQYAAAVRVAQHQADRLAGRLTSATAVVRPGQVSQANLAGACDSGSVVRIRLTGRFPHLATGGAVGSPGGPVTTVDITADGTSGRACLLGVATGKPTPYRHAADLMPALDVG
jgi:hypothetical protein